MQECGKRYRNLDGTLETICADLLSNNLNLPGTDLIVANLLVEYIGYGCFQKEIRLINPKYISCIIQINEGESFVSDSPYIHAFDCLDEVHHQMEEETLIGSMGEINYRVIHTSERLLPNGKKLVRIDFGK